MSEISGMSKREFCSLLLGASSAAILSEKAGAQDSETLSIAFPTDVQSWDPTAVTFPPGQSIFKCVFDSPLHYSLDQKLVTRQLRSHRWINDDNTRLEITLEDGIVFHDETALTMSDVRYSWIERPLNDRKLAIAGMIPDLADLEILSPTKGVLVFSKPAPSVEFNLGFLACYILPKAYHQKMGDDGFVSKPIGAGPYRLVEYQRGSRIVLEAFDKYWRGAPSIKRAVFQILPEPSTRVAAVEAGRVDVAVQLPFREAVRLQKKNDLAVKIYPQAELYMIQIPSYVPTFQNGNVRKALHFAIDKRALSKAFFNSLAKPLDVLALPNSPADIPDFSVPYDRPAAIELLKAEGFTAKNPLSIRFLCTNGTFPNDYEISRAIAAMWRAVGVDATIEETTLAKYIELNHSAKLPGPMFYSWANPTGDPENDIGRILNPRLRFSAWKDPSLDERIAKLLAMKLSNERIEGYRSLAREASENSWSIPLLQTVGNIVSKKDIDVPGYAAGYILPAEITRKPA